MNKALLSLLLVLLAAAALPQALFAARETWLATDTEHFTIVFKEENRAAGLAFNEINAKNSNFLISPGYLLMEKFIKEWRNVVRS